MAKSKVRKKYMSDGNNPEAVEGGQFPVLQLADGGRIVGRAGQDIVDLVKQAKARGDI